MDLPVRVHPDAIAVWTLEMKFRLAPALGGLLMLWLFWPGWHDMDVAIRLH